MRYITVNTIGAIGLILTVFIIGYPVVVSADNVCTESLEFKGTYSCTGQDPNDYPDDAARGFYNRMGYHGHTKKYLYENNSCYNTDWHEDRRGQNECSNWNGNDYTYMDSCEYSWVSTHGQTYCDSGCSLTSNHYWKGALMTNAGGGDVYCNISSDHMRLGDTAPSYYAYNNAGFGPHGSVNKYLMLYACHGLDLDWIEHWHSRNICSNTPNSNYGVFQGLHMIFGFDGDAELDHMTHVEDGEDVADDMHDDNIADAWLWGVSDWYWENWIVVMSAGSSYSDAVWRLDAEWYPYATDPYPPGGYAWVYIEG